MISTTAERTIVDRVLQVTVKHEGEPTYFVHTPTGIWVSHSQNSAFGRDYAPKGGVAWVQTNQTAVDGWKMKGAIIELEETPKYLEDRFNKYAWMFVTPFAWKVGHDEFTIGATFHWLAMP